MYRNLLLLLTLLFVLFGWRFHPSRRTQVLSSYTRG